jgi:hypothetical protein
MALRTLTFALLFSVGCDGGGSKILGTEHPGWQRPGCTGLGCHEADDHTSRPPARCVECHGANGACVPPSYHKEDQPCASCHLKKHGFEGDPDCVACHYTAVEGKRQCKAGGPPDAGL